MEVDIMAFKKTLNAPTSTMRQLAQSLGLMKKDLLYKFYPDLQMNNIDPRRIHESKLKLRLLMRFSDNSDYFPMIKATT